MTGPRRTRGLAIGAGLTAAAAVAATVILVPAGSRNAAPVSLSARQVLLAAATVAAAQRPVSGTYWHVEEAFDSSEPAYRHIQDTWTVRDGAFWVADPAGTGVLPLGGPGGFSVATISVTFRQLQGLPQRPAALKAWVTYSFEHPAYAQLGVPSASILPSYVAMALVDLLTDMPVPPGVRAAAFGALASMPDVKSLGHVDGGQALLITGPPARMPPGHKLPPGAFPLGDVEVVIDPATAQVLSIITIGQTETVLSEGWTNQMPKVDPVPPKKTAPKG